MTDANLSLVAGQGSDNSSGQESREPDTGLIGLVMRARFHGVAADPDQLANWAELAQRCKRARFSKVGVGGTANDGVWRDAA